MPRAIGTATISARTEVSTVPNASAATPKWGGLSFGNHFVVNRKLTVLARRAGTALAIRKMAMATMMTSTIAPAETLRLRKPDSIEKRDFFGSAAPPPPRGVRSSGGIGSYGGVGETPVPA